MQRCASLYWPLVALVLFLVTTPHVSRAANRHEPHKNTIRPFIIPYDHSDYLKLQHRLNETLYLMKTEWKQYGAFHSLYSTPATRWEMGTDLDQLIELVQYWLDEFNWKQQVEKLNSKLPHFETTITLEDQEDLIRFAWRQSSKQSDLPLDQRKVLLIIHGWPGNVWEFHKIVNELVEEKGFDVVAPSIPGYGFSSAPKTEGYDVKKVASLFVKLMRELGYGKYVVQGGDWGSLIGENVARLDSTHCIGYHSNMCVTLPYWQDWLQVAVDSVKKIIYGTPLIENTESFSSFLLYTVKYFTADGGYQHIQSTRPDSLGIALLDSPVGTMAYILEKFISWTDIPQKDTSQLFTRISRDDFLTIVMIYQSTRTIASSIRLYYFTMANNAQKSFGEDKPYLTTPTACAVFKDLFRATRYTAQRNFNLVQFNRFEQGGHFAALENPKALVQDVVTFATNRFDTSMESKKKEKNEL
ncbi:hypothetical protein C9374_002575 [Naegleria lovaniensis]|uniref:AB hydrolase-1 domain-containing protein n=1 Tax=Naegleria lovaniensis TaxID=51637 RepID=A0AA88GU16_NAELO|nr:uncharacterized protein C9374_002575 [Naegleria lovaniensis]KAG2386129.1 hypothetical protein C9374_002575 [Naegleria lovaniensis]